jgi:propanediol dehydratase small subunit
MILVFQHDTSLHRLSFQIPDSELKRLRTSNQAWRADLTTNSMVDAYIKAEDLRTNNTPLYGWLQARVVSVDGDKLYLEFEKSSN